MSAIRHPGLPRVAAFAFAILSTGVAFAQTVTPVPLTAFTRPSWMAPGSQTITGGVQQVVQNASGFRWDVLVGADAGTNPDIFNAVKLAAINGGTFTYVTQFDPALLAPSGTAQPGFLSINMFQQGFGGGSGDKWVQTFTRPTLGSNRFPLSKFVTSTTSLAIVGWTNGVDPTPADNTNNFYVERNSTYFQFGFGMNSSNLSAMGFNLVSATITAVPEPGSTTMLGCFAGIGGLVTLARRGLQRTRRA